MLWLKSFHLIFMVTWFSGLFYLPRLYVYHATSSDLLSIERFKVMERKLLFQITTPSGVLATLFGIGLLYTNAQFYLDQTWMQIKLSIVVLLWIYHLTCIHYYRIFKQNKNQKSALFFRYFNEIPALFLIATILLAVFRPSF